MREVLDDLLAISRYAGADLLLAQGGGGNTSVKAADGTRMWIKASGLRLGQVREGYGYVETDLPALKRLVADAGLRVLPAAEAHAAAGRGVGAAVRGGGGLRASLETTFHAVLGRLVLHTHPVYVNAFTCLAGGEAALREALAGEAQAGTLWVPYATPGYALGVAVDEALGHVERGSTVIVLANHGLIVQGDEAETLIALTEQMVAVGRRWFGPLPEQALAVENAAKELEAWAEVLQAALLAKGLVPGDTVVRPTRFAYLNAAAADLNSGLSGGPLMPDDVVYAGRAVVGATAGQAPEAVVGGLEAEELAGRLAVAVEGLGLVLAGPSEAFVAAMEETLLAHALVRGLIAQAGGQPVNMPGWAVDELCGMEAEKHRRAVATGFAGRL